MELQANSDRRCDDAADGSSRVPATAGEQQQRRCGVHWQQWQEAAAVENQQEAAALHWGSSMQETAALEEVELQVGQRWSSSRLQVGLQVKQQ